MAPLTMEGAQNLGVVWELSPSRNGKWTEKILHSFNGKSGSYPFSGIVIDSDGRIGDAHSAATANPQPSSLFLTVLGITAQC